MIKSGESRRERVRTAESKSRTKVTKVSPLGRSESKASSPSPHRINQSFDKSKEHLDLRDNSVETHCKCSVNHGYLKTENGDDDDASLDRDNNCPVHHSELGAKPAHSRSVSQSPKKDGGTVSLKSTQSNNAFKLRL